MIVLDTNIVIHLLNGNKTVAERLDAISPNDAALSFVSVGALLFGGRRSRCREENLEKIRRFLDTIRIIHSSREIAEIYGDLKDRSLKSRLFPGDHDLWIAATALQSGSTLVTRNTKHFGWIGELSVEDWQR